MGLIHYLVVLCKRGQVSKLHLHLQQSRSARNSDPLCDTQCPTLPLTAASLPRAEGSSSHFGRALSTSHLTSSEVPPCSLGNATSLVKP